MEKFGDLLLMERLAAGGMAEVFRGKQLGYAGFEKTVAIKRILPHFASSEEFKNMFRLEANLSAMLQHTNISQIFANGEHEGYLYLVMEFVDGKNLRQLLGKADKLKFRIPVEIACFVVGEAAKGLDYAHNFIDEKTGQPMNIVHRDVSPQNIMLGYEGSVKLVDFGIAKVAARAESTRAGVLKGKFGYMSPEQARGDTLDKRSDIFAMGIILWELLTQRRLFSSDDEMKTLQNVRECKVPRPSSKNPTLPYALEKIVMRALEKDPSNRYSSAGDLYGDLVRYMNDRHPSFIPTDLTKFMKEFYKEEIADEKRRREKLNLEAPAYMAAHQSPAKRKKVEKQNDEKDGDRTNVNTDEDTLVSGVHNEHKVSHIENDDIRESLNMDPSKQAGANTMRMPPPLEVTSNRKIQITSSVQLDALPSLQTQTQTQTNNKTQSRVAATAASALRAKNEANRKNIFLQLGLGVLFLSVGAYGVKTYLDQEKSNDTPITSNDVNQAETPPQKNDPLDPKVEINANANTSEASSEVSNVITDNTSSTGITDPAQPVEPIVNAQDSSINPNAEGRDPASLSGQLFILEALADNAYGTITLSGVPEANVVNIDGKRLVDASKTPMKTPFKNLKFPPGRYQVELKNTVFNVSKTLEMVVEKNKSNRFEVILNKR